MARLSQIAVYYPYIHFRDASWLKIAALYWPRMVRIVHPDYPTRNSALVEVLQDELGFVVDHSPASAAQAMVDSFTELVNTLPVERLSAWRLPRELGGRDPSEMSLPEPPEPLEDGCVPELEHYGPREWAGPDQLAEGIRAGALAGVHTSEVAPQLATGAARHRTGSAGAGVVVRDAPAVGVDLQVSADGGTRSPGQPGRHDRSNVRTRRHVRATRARRVDRYGHP